MTVRLTRAALAVLSACCLLMARARADLVWDPAGGWRIEGGVLAGLTGGEGQTALNLMNKARREEDRGSIHGALRDYTKITKKYPSSIYAPEAFYRLAKLRLARKQYYKAFDAYQQIIARYPNEKRFSEIIDAQYQIATALLDGARNHAWGWLATFPNRERGIQYCQAILVSAPYSDYAPLALMNIARGQQYMNNRDDAIDALDQLVSGYQSSVLAPEAYLRLAQLHGSLVEGPYYDQGETKQAISYYEDFMILFPGDQKIGQAADGLDHMKTVLAESKMLIGDFYFYKRDNYIAARVFYNEAITSYPDSPVAKRAKDRLAAVEAKASGRSLAPVPGEKKKHFLFF